MRIYANEIVLQNSKQRVKTQYQNNTGIENKKSVNFGAKTNTVGIKRQISDLKLLGTAIAGALAIVTALGYGTRQLCNKKDDKRAENYVYNNITSVDSENGIVITKNEEISFQEAMDFYQSQKKEINQLNLLKADRYKANLLSFMNNSTLPDSDEGIKITEKEKDSYNYAQNNNLIIKKQCTNNEDANGKKVIVPLPLPIHVAID
ncbi:MAG: hypothetical protein MJ231_06495 [bacterium]|nr:hypothetical protein [bacterium]